MIFGRNRLKLFNYSNRSVLRYKKLEPCSPLVQTFNQEVSQYSDRCYLTSNTQKQQIFFRNCLKAIHTI